MLFRIAKPFVFIALLVVLVSTACLNTGGKTETSVPEKTQSSEAPTQEQATAKPASSSSGAVKNLDDVKGAVFQIIGTGTYYDVNDGEQLNAEWGGSGFFIDSSGIGITNNHVVAGAALLKAYVSGETKPRNVTVLGTSECEDLAVVQVQGDGFPYLDWYDGTVKTGLDVYAAGFPLLEPEYNLTKGIISKTDAEGQTTWASLDYIYGHDAKINGGNSGGPLVTEDGKVVGINYSSRASLDQQFAIPADLAIPIVKQLQEKQNVASVGLAGTAIVFGPNGEYPGIWVESTTTGGIADKAGIQPGDIIHKVETILIATDGTMKDYCDILRSHSESDQLKVTIYRPSTDEILEGTLNGDKLAVTGTAGLGGGTSGPGTGDNSGTTTYNSGDTIVSTSFDDMTGWFYFTVPGKVEDIQVKQRPSRVYLEVNKTYTELYFLNDLSLNGPIHMTTNVESVAGPNTNNISLVCRATDKGWYEFSMSSGGYWWIWKYDYVKNNYSALAKGGSTAIHLQKASNELQAECNGEDLIFWINGKKVGSASDPDFPEGQFGVGVYADKIKGVGVDINDFASVVP